MKRPLWKLLALALAFALVAGACGNDDSDVAAGSDITIGYLQWIVRGDPGPRHP